VGKAAGADRKRPVAPPRPTHASRTARNISLGSSLPVMKSEVASRDGVAFSEEEVAFLAENRLARVATASCDGQPHVVPVVYEFDGRDFYFTGWNLERSLKFRNLVENKKVALVVDDIVTVSPWRPRGVEVRGVAELGKEGGRAYVKVSPSVKRSWGFR
jgi:pyridoxamine 5'-phosphate oxidase family protein